MRDRSPAPRDGRRKISRPPLVLLAMMTAAAAGCYYVVDQPMRANVGSRQGAAAPEDGGPTGDAAAPASGPLLVEVQRIEAWLTGRGFERVTAPLAGELAEGARRRYEAELLSGLCYVAVAVGGETVRELDLTLLDGSSTERARDLRAGRRAALRHCAAISGTYQLEVTAAEGTGPFASAVYRAPPGDHAPLAELFDSEPPQAPAEPPTEPPPPGGEVAGWTRLVAVEEALRRDGFQRVGQPVVFHLVEGARVRRDASLATDACYVLAVAAEGGAQDADAFLYDPSGVRVAFDATDERDAQVRFCPAAAGTYQMEVRLQRGTGTVLAMLLRGPRQDGAAFATDEASQGLAASYAAMDRDLQARGYEGLGSASPATLLEGGSSTLGLEAEAGECYAVGAVGSEPLTNLGVLLRDPAGTVVDRDGGRRDALVRVCPELAGRHDAEIVATRGAGTVLARAYRFTRGSRGAFGLTGLLHLRAMETVAVLGGEGYEPAAAPVTSARQRLAEGRAAVHRVRLERGACYAIAAVGGEGLRDLDLALASPTGAPVAAELGPNPLPIVRACPTASGSYRLTATAREGSGPYAFQVFRRTATDGE